MITIGKPYVIEAKEGTYLKAKVQISDDTAMKYIEKSQTMYLAHWRVNRDYPPAIWKKDNYSMWFKVPKEYGKYLATETSDAFLRF